MPPISTDAIMQATIEGRHENQQVLSVFTYNLVLTAGAEDTTALLNAFWINWQGNGGMLEKWVNAVSAKVTAVKTRLQFVAPDRYAYMVKTSATLNAGQVAGDAMPVNTAAAITKRTDLAGRDNVGTLHMPGVPASFILNGALTAIALEKYQDLADKMKLFIITVAPAAEFHPTLYHRANPQVTIPFTSTEVAPFARVMRRRTVGVGS